MTAYQVQEFADLAGVTVRTLHYYDQIGLLTPQRRNQTRLYRENDLLRLQQILTLKYLGFSLEEIHSLLTSPVYDVRHSLEIQLMAIRERIVQLREVEKTLESTIAHVENADAIDWGQVTSMIRAIQRNNKENWLRHYYNDEQLAMFEERQADYSPEQVAEWTQQWTDLIAGFRELQHLPPDHPDVQQLAGKFAELIRLFTQGNEEIARSLKAMYTHPEHMPSEYRMVEPDLLQFMNTAAQIYQEKQT